MQVKEWISHMDIRGEGGVSLGKLWEEPNVPQAYLGLTIARQYSRLLSFHKFSVTMATLQSFPTFSFCSARTLD